MRSLLLASILFLAAPLYAADFAVDGDTLLLDGEIAKGDETRIASIFEQNPEVKRLSIRSPGGDLDTGLRIGEIVRKRKLETYVEGGVREAASAAAYVFMGGVERVVKGERGVGVHAFYTPAGELRSMMRQKTGDELVPTLREFERRTQEATVSVVAYVTTMIGDARIVSEAVKSGSDALVWPSAKSLLDMKVATKRIELTPEEIPDADWVYGEIVSGLAAWLDAAHENALDERARTALEAFLADDARAAKLRSDIDDIVAKNSPPNRSVARERLVAPLVKGIVEQFRAAAAPENR